MDAETCAWIHWDCYSLHQDSQIPRSRTENARADSKDQIPPGISRGSTSSCMHQRSYCAIASVTYSNRTLDEFTNCPTRHLFTCGRGCQEVQNLPRYQNRVPKFYKTATVVLWSKKEGSHRTQFWSKHCEILRIERLANSGARIVRFDAPGLRPSLILMKQVWIFYSRLFSKTNGAFANSFLWTVMIYTSVYYFP